MHGPILDTLMPITLPQVKFNCKSFSSITRGVMAAIYTLWVMVGDRQDGLLVFCPSIVPKQVDTLTVYMGDVLTRLMRPGASKT